MKETNKIVVPVDFLKATDRLVDYAIYMADKLSATAHFIHVINFYPGDAMFGIPYAQQCEENLQMKAKEKMANIITDNKEKCVGCTGEVVRGDPVDKIIECAKEKDSDLIIISTHGAKGLEKIMLGSVAERVLKRAHCPVLIMNPYRN
ncbi:MAG: nucleotide-binding universal stress UspA family protein [Desulforhopalus sp.]|jgi:nucleotide-binding universal stress UspA family protein